MWVLGWISLLAGVSFLPGSVRSEPQVPCFFVFGDSLVDNGNNNQIASIARANYAPYGIDFPDGATGRFCNGKTTVDVISELLGFENYIPPYSEVRGDAILRGVNYASAAAGIRQETGRQLGGRIYFGAQVQNYRTTVSQMVGLFGDEDSAAEHLSRCIYSVGMGSNDYLNNYFMPAMYSTSNQYTPQQYAQVLITQYTDELKTLYRFGARKIAIIGVGLVGCAPNELARYSDSGVTCISKIDNAIKIFNNKLINMVDTFNDELPSAMFTFINPYNMLGDILKNPQQYGFTNSNSGCCGVGRNNGQITCLPMQSPCENRNKYIFWDAFHPTEAANIIFGKRAYSAHSPKDSHPVDLKTLASM